MKRDLVEILACPLCKGALQLSVEEEDGGEVVSGSLYCARCEANFPIVEAIPNLLPPEPR